ncbi:DNA alkylation repair protein [uncultured Ligilactobacillus sp.]|uniref:DNA alkylation repair protein n=1 Tax=uncultured Ligilactobacillus sp. TaxID=2837633 RepID=UPI00272C146D|nr:DNA alkylation repair protein [uncultured Ligilactobacillus sp.]
MKTKDDLFTVIDMLSLEGDAKQAKSMSAYMRDQFEFLGIKTPKRRQLCRAAFKNAKKTAKIDWEFVEICWQKSQREYQYVACDYLVQMKKFTTLEDLPKLKKLVITKSWWETVDTLVKVFTDLYLRYPKEMTQVMLTWSKDSNLWVKRVTLEFQLLLKKQTDTKLLAKVIINNLGSNEFFINKAIGWALRDYSKTDPKWVAGFIATYRNELSALSIHEGSKYLA